MKVVNPSFNKLMIGMGLIVVLLLVAIAWMAGSLIAKKSAQLEEQPVAQQGMAQQEMAAGLNDGEGVSSSLSTEPMQQQAETASETHAGDEMTSQQSQQMDVADDDQQQMASSESDSQSAEPEVMDQAAQQMQASSAAEEADTQSMAASTQQSGTEADEGAVHAGEQQDAAQAATAAMGGGLAQKIASELEDLQKQSSQEAAQSGSKKEVYVYMKGKLVRVEDIDLSKLKEEDLSYVEQIKKMEEADQKPQQSGTPKVSSAQVKQAQVAEDGRKKGLELNQVVVQEGASKSGGLASQLQQLAQRTAETDQPKRQEDKQYVSSLNPLEKERENEVRYIRVRPGDSLWKIAERAYGSGFMYPKIFKANPQLKSPDMIQVGDLLRVPL